MCDSLTLLDDLIVVCWRCFWSLFDFISCDSIRHDSIQLWVNQRCILYQTRSKQGTLNCSQLLQEWKVARCIFWSFILYRGKKNNKQLFLSVRTVVRRSGASVDLRGSLVALLSAWRLLRHCVIGNWVSVCDSYQHQVTVCEVAMASP